jgi:chorismate synthase
MLEPLGIKVVAYTLELGGIRAERVDLDFIEKSPLFCPDPISSERMEKAISNARKEGDSLGGIAEICVTGCPAGLGEPVFDKLDADLAKALMSVGTVKGVEIGAGFEAARLKGSENNDPITPNGFGSNWAGGILGGISNGDQILLRAAVKPIPSITQEQNTIDREGHPAKMKFTGRHDIASIPRIIPVLEAMVKIVLADHYLRSKAIT